MRRLRRSLCSVLAVVMLMTVFMSVPVFAFTLSGEEIMFSWVLDSDGTLTINQKISDMMVNISDIGGINYADVKKVVYNYKVGSYGYCNIRGTADLKATSLVLHANDSDKAVSCIIQDFPYCTSVDFGNGKFSYLNTDDVAFTSVNLPAGVKEVTILDSNLTSLDLPDSVEQLILCDNQLLSSVDLPDGIKQVRIEDSVLTSLTVPDSVERLYLIDLANLTTLTLPQSALEYIEIENCGIRSFNALNTYERVRINEGSLKTATIQEGRTLINDFMFTSCTELTSVNIPSGVTKVEYFAFSDCSKLKNLDLPDSVQGIGANAFSGTAIESFSIPSGVTKIEYGTFMNCSKLASLTIPASVNEIDISAFRSCSNLKDIYFGGSEAQWNQITTLERAFWRDQGMHSNYSASQIIGNANVHYNSALNDIHVTQYNEGVIEAPVSANKGDEVTVIAYAWDGYSLDSLTVKDPQGNKVTVTVTDNGDYKFTMPEADVYITASFSVATYNVNVSSNQAGGKVTVSRTTAQMGDTVTMSYTVNHGYRFIRYLVTDATGVYLKFNGNTFVMPGCSVNVSGMFAPIEYDIAVGETEHGHITFSLPDILDKIGKEVTSAKATVEDEIKVYVYPDEGYLCSSILVNGKKITGDSFMMPAENAVITAVFVKDTYKWIKQDGKWTYQDSLGNRMKGIAEIDGKSYFFDKDGFMKTGWIKTDDSGWMYANKQGELLTGWQRISKVWYYLDPQTFVAATGIKEIGGKLYWFKDSGALTTGWRKADTADSYYYFTTDGAVKGWKQIGKVWYYFDKQTCLMVKGAVEIGGTVYLFDANGAMMKKGWKSIGGEWYYLNKDGSAYVNKWLKSGKKWYYFNGAGEMVTGTSIDIKGKIYNFDESGVCLNP